MKSFHVTTGQVRFGLLVVLVVALLAAILAWPVGAQEEPQDFTVTESADITGDSTSATIIAAPAGADPSVSDPGEVYIVSGTNGSVVITITGASDGDWFGYSTAVAGDLNSDGYKDIIIGAPKDGNGRAYLFYGPFRDDGPLSISATDADRFFASPDPADYDFGEAVAPVHDLTADGVPELRIRAWFIDAGGWENSHTYIVNGATGQGLFRITGTFPFDPWAIVEGDADGDGDVDQDDLDIILANQGRTGPDLSAQDGDVNGDGVVDMVDYNLADGNFGAAIFGGFGGLISQCTDPCPENCVGEIADNAEGFCGPICPADCGCAYDLIPLPDNWPDGLTDPPHEYERAFQIAILVYPHGDDEAVWDIDGVELIQSLEIFENYITFETAGFGQVLVTATYACCQGGCGTMEIPIFITCNGIPEPWLDTDYDGIVDGDECQLGLNWNFSDTDGDSMPDGWELDMEFDPLDPIDGDLDADQDGIPNFLEFLYGSDPFNAGSGADPVHDLDEDGFIDWLEEVLGSNPADSSSIPSVDFTPGDMLWVQTSGAMITLTSEIIELCVDDCVRFHATGVAESWEVLQGRDLVQLVDPDGPGSCYSGKWCITAPGDIIIAAATPQPDGSIVLGYLQIHALSSGECPPPCIAIIGAPDAACPGDVVCLQATGGGSGTYVWTVLEFASFVGGNTGSTVYVQIDEPGEIAVGVTKGDCAGITSFPALRVDLDMDSNRNGVVQDTDDDDEDESMWEYGTTNTGAVILVNSDDDDGNGEVDSQNGTVDGATDVADLAPLVIRPLGGNAPAGWTLTLTVETGGGKVRVFNGRDAAATEVISPTPPYEYEIPLGDVNGDGPPLEYGVEAVEYPGWPTAAFDGLVKFSLSLTDDLGAPQCVIDVVEARVAPWLMPSHLDPVDAVYVSTGMDAEYEYYRSTPGSPLYHPEAFPDRLTDALQQAGQGAVQLIVIDTAAPGVEFPAGDPWLQDQIEIGYHSAPGDLWRHVVLNSPRDRQVEFGPVLHNYAENSLLSPDIGAYGIQATHWILKGNTYEAFGDLEALPPVISQAGTDWSIGFVFHGSGMQSELLGFLDGQVVQGTAPDTVLDTAWLDIGHVDEFVSVQQTGPNAFRAILADPLMGAVLIQLNPNVPLDSGQYYEPDDLTKVSGDLIDPDDGLDLLNIRIHDIIYGTGGLRDRLIQMGITDIVPVPAIFAPVIPESPETSTVFAALPDMLNMLNVNGALIVADPMFAPFSDDFTQAVGGSVVFIDCLEYHWNAGEVHCGTNTRRTPSMLKWWEVEP